MAIVRLISCNDYVQANILKATLMDAGIKCFLKDENINALLPHLHGIMHSEIDLMINEEEYDTAKKIIDTGKEELICPNCLSDNVVFRYGRKKNRSKLFLILLSLLMWLPFGNLRRDYYCKECGTLVK